MPDLGAVKDPSPPRPAATLRALVVVNLIRDVVLGGLPPDVFLPSLLDARSRFGAPVVTPVPVGTTHGYPRVVSSPQHRTVQHRVKSAATLPPPRPSGIAPTVVRNQTLAPRSDRNAFAW